MEGLLAPMFTELVVLERQVADAIEAAELPRPRVYPWRPPANIQLPAIYNWIDDGEVQVPDTQRVDDVIVVTVSIAITPNLTELNVSIDRLVALTDVFRVTVDPALKRNQPLNGTAKTARRMRTNTSFDEFPEITAMCMEQHIEVQLPRLVA